MRRLHLLGCIFMVAMRNPFKPVVIVEYLGVSTINDKVHVYLQIDEKLYYGQVGQAVGGITIIDAYEHTCTVRDHSSFITLLCGKKKALQLEKAEGLGG